MKVILLTDVKKVGKKHDQKVVADGYALNFLIPRKMAEISTEGSLKKLETRKALAEGEKKIQEDLLMKNLKSLKDAVITLVESANEKGHLFKGVHQDELVVAIKKETGLDLAPEYIILEKPLKELGEFTVEAKVQDKTVSFKVVINKAV